MSLRSNSHSARPSPASGSGQPGVPRMGTHPRREVSVEIPGGAIALDRPARPVIALLMDEDRIQEAALCSIARLWPGVGLRELQSHCREWQRVFARYCFAHLLAREAGL